MQRPRADFRRWPHIARNVFAINCTAGIRSATHGFTPVDERCNMPGLGGALLMGLG